LRLLCTVLAERALPAEEARILETAAAESEGSRLQPLLYQVLAEARSFVGDVPRALDAVARAVDAHLLDIVWMDRCPALAAARAEPRFAPLRASVAERAARVVAVLARPTL
jgi:hypothetical protein